MCQKGPSSNHGFKLFYCTHLDTKLPFVRVCLIRMASQITLEALIINAEMKRRFSEELRAAINPMLGSRRR